MKILLKKTRAFTLTLVFLVTLITVTTTLASNNWKNIVFEIDAPPDIEVQPSSLNFLPQDLTTNYALTSNSVAEKEYQIKASQNIYLSTTIRNAHSYCIGKHMLPVGWGHH